MVCLTIAKTTGAEILWPLYRLIDASRVNGCRRALHEVSVSDVTDNFIVLCVIFDQVDVIRQAGIRCVRASVTRGSADKTPEILPLQYRFPKIDALVANSRTQSLSCIKLLRRATV